MKRSTSSLWSGILFLFCAYCFAALAITEEDERWWTGALPFAAIGGAMVLAAIISMGVRWALEDVREQRAIDSLEDLEDEAYG